MKALAARVRVRVPATSANLGPGFDCLGLALGLYNEVEAEPADGWAVVARGEGAEALPAGAENLVARAARRVLEEAGAAGQALRLRLVNGIPLARGLGSSAAAVVGGMVAANALLGLPLGRDRILELAAEMEGHGDNAAPALWGGVTVFSPRAGGGVVLRLDPPAGLRLGLVIPEATVSTAAARAVLPEQVPRADAVHNVQRACLLVACLATGRLESLGAALADRLHQPYRGGLVPGLAEALALRVPGVLGVCLSGSGPTLLCFLEPGLAGEAVARALSAVAAPLKERGVPCRLLPVSPEATGAAVVASTGL